jgi:hypothetical protein
MYLLLVYSAKGMVKDIWIVDYSTHTRTVKSLAIPLAWLGKASFASSPNNPKGALNF